MDSFLRTIMLRSLNIDSNIDGNLDRPSTLLKSYRRRIHCCENVFRWKTDGNK